MTTRIVRQLLRCYMDGVGCPSACVAQSARIVPTWSRRRRSTPALGVSPAVIYLLSDRLKRSSLTLRPYALEGDKSEEGCAAGG
jgi:hypothetical protein